MSFRNLSLTLVCFAALWCGAHAGFSAVLTQGTSVSLNNGANSLIANGASWSTACTGGFTDGQFQADGGYAVPVQGVYHFDTSIQVAVSSNTAPKETVDVRLVKCANGCNALCGGGNNVAATLLQGGEVYLADGFNGAAPPSYSLSLSFTGFFNTGDIIAVCLDSNANSGAVQLSCPSTQSACHFSGFQV